MKNVIIFLNDEGICNRVKKIIIVLRSLKLDKSCIYLKWITNYLVSDSFYSLFSFESKDVELIEDKDLVFNDKDCVDVGIDCDWKFRIEKEYHPTQFIGLRNQKIKDENIINFKYNDIPQNIKNDYLHYFNCFKPSELVKKRMEEIDSKEYVSVHVRDNSQWRAANRGSDINKYFVVLDKYPADVVFFLASCDENVSSSFRERYGKRIIELKNKNIRSSIDAVAELFLLSRGKEFVASYGSTFSEVAWWFSGASIKVTEVGIGNERYMNTVAKIKYKLYEIAKYGLMATLSDALYQIKRQYK